MRSFQYSSTKAVAVLRGVVEYFFTNSPLLTIYDSTAARHICVVLLQDSRKVRNHFRIGKNYSPENFCLQSW